MRELELTIDEALIKGLSPITNPPINSQFLYECLGWRCGKGGLEVHKTLSNPLTSLVDMYYDWPFPQMLSGEKYNILIVRDATADIDYVYSISSNNQTAALITTINSKFGAGSMFSAADFGEYIFITNGVIMIYWNPATNQWQKTAENLSIPTIKTVTNLKGQAIGGNVVSSWYDCDETYYVWSKIGSMDFEIDKGNEAGYRRCPYGGEVHDVKRLGDVAVGYSSEGITLLSPVMEPTPTFGFKEMSDIGIINQGAVGGDDRVHLYVGEDYMLRRVSEKGIEELGYESYIGQLTSGDIIVSYDKGNKDFYIGDESKTFLLSPYGMSEILQHPSAVWRRNKVSYAIPSTIDSTPPEICVSAFDMTYRGQKTIFSMESDLTLGSGVYLGADASFDQSTWNSALYTPMNDQGIGAIILAGNAFRFRIKATSLDEDSKISYIKARYKMTDLRGIRGVYAPPPRGQ